MIVWLHTNPYKEFSNIVFLGYEIITLIIESLDFKNLVLRF